MNKRNYPKTATNHQGVTKRVGSRDRHFTRRRDICQRRWTIVADNHRIALSEACVAADCLQLSAVIALNLKRLGFSLTRVGELPHKSTGGAKS